MRTEREVVQELAVILEANREKRVSILGTFCCGKSTLARCLSGVRDMDEIVFPRLSPEQVTLVSQRWTPEVGATMARLARQIVEVEPGQAVIGTVLLDCDLVVRLRITRELLAERTARRSASLHDAERLDSHIEQELAASGLPVVVVSLG